MGKRHSGDGRRRRERVWVATKAPHRWLLLAMILWNWDGRRHRRTGGGYGRLMCGALAVPSPPRPTTRLLPLASTKRMRAGSAFGAAASVGSGAFRSRRGSASGGSGWAGGAAATRQTSARNSLWIRGGSSGATTGAGTGAASTSSTPADAGGTSTQLMASTAATPDDNDNDQALALLPASTYNQTTIDAGSLPISTLLSQLCTNVVTGLTTSQHRARLQKYGRNALETPPAKSIWTLIAEQFEDRLVQILLAVAALSGVFSYMELRESYGANGDPEGGLLQSFVEPLVILAILILNAAVGVWQSKSAEGSLEALKSLQPSLATALRNGEWVDNLDASELVPGDVIALTVGDKIPADARLLSLRTSTLSVDEGSLTGESVTVQKIPGDEGTNDPGAPVQDRRGTVFGGTVVTSGAGLGVVLATGMHTEMGKIQRGVTAAKEDEQKTPLGIKLDEFGDTLTVIIGVICLAVWIVSIPKFDDASFGGNWIEGAVYYAKVAVALGVAAIPEGLPAVITLCLSLGTRRMAQRNVIVRKLPSVETLGCTSVICTDKTGTLTTNEMTAVSLVLLEDAGYGCGSGDGEGGGGGKVVEHAISGVSYSPVGTVDGIAPHDEVSEKPTGAVADVARVSALCNDARVVGRDDGVVTDDDQGEEASGSAGGERVPKKTPKKKKKKKKKDEAAFKTYERVGEPTEAALCVLAEKLGGGGHGGGIVVATPPQPAVVVGSDASTAVVAMTSPPPPSARAAANVNAWRASHPRTATLEFNRDRKSMSVLCRDSDDGGGGSSSTTTHGANRLFVKGAPNLLLDRCTRVKFRDGTVRKLTGELRRQIEAKTSELAQRPLRCLALAVKETDDLDKSLRTYAPDGETNDGTAGADGADGGSGSVCAMSDNAGDSARKHPLLSDPSNYVDIESGLTLVGIVGIKDPARPEVADSIAMCTKAGVRVLMITGDARDTAVAIARDVNIFPPKVEGAQDDDDVKAYEGREFFEKPDAEQLELLKSGNMVFCRAEPADKQKLVKMLQSLGEIPAMTGDGVNDAPALSQAAIGIAMGITGTEVSKEAADMVLADDNFSTIVSAVEEGRCIYANMQAFICFLISCNIGEICAILLATIAGFPEPLTAMHLLWVNLVTDGPPATALGFNPPAPDLMEQSPRPSDEPIMTRWLLTRYCLTGLYVGLATIGIFAGHYMSQGVTLSELSSWSKCGEMWTPSQAGLMCEDLFQGAGRSLPQTLSLTTLVCMEMLKALSAVSVDNSLIVVPSWKNRWLLLGVAVPFMLHLAVLYSDHLGVPALGESFGMVPLSWENWITVLKWSAPILIVDEVLKAVGRWVNKSTEEERRAAALETN